MGAQVQENDIEVLPVNPWLRAPSHYRATREQVRFAMDLCRTELPYTERIATINTFAGLSSADMSGLIENLLELRGKRMARLRGRRRSRR